MKKIDSVYAASPDSLEFYAAQALKLTEQLKDIPSETKIQALRGVTLFLSGEHDKALKIYINAIRKAEKHPPFKELALLYYETGGLYSKNNDLITSGQYVSKGLKIALAAKNAAAIADGYNRVGVLYEKRKLLDSALHYYQNSLRTNKLAKDTLGMSYSMENIAGIYAQKDQPVRSIPYLKESLRLRKLVNNKFSLAIIHVNLAETYNALNKPDSAIKYANETIKIATEIKFLDIIKHTHNFLADIYEKKGDLKNALRHHQSFSTINDSIYNETKSKQIAELSKKFETEKKEQQIKSLHQQSTIQNLKIRQRTIMLAIAATLIVFISGLSYLIYNRRKLREEARLQSEINKHQEQTARAVLNAEEHERRRIATDLHDGVGQLLSVALMNMNTLFGKLKEGKIELSLADRSVALINESYDEMRTISHQMIPNALLKAGLSAAVREFLSKIDENKIKVTLETSGLDERLDEQTETLIYRIIQEAVNNVIKHAQASKLNIQLVRDEEGILLMVEDNGKGFDKTAVNQKKGIGLKNMLDRVELLKGTAEFDSAPGKGTLLAVNIPA
ncbi:MAG: sensor histidine kinase [Sphingobacteriaceae bacterium]|nr:sensor histidine kinase [Sphingobacteriaceae bacterium]